jgi:hypothetical protein
VIPLMFSLVVSAYFYCRGPAALSFERRALCPSEVSFSFCTRAGFVALVEVFGESL